MWCTKCKTPKKWLHVTNEEFKFVGYCSSGMYSLFQYYILAASFHWYSAYVLHLCLSLTNSSDLRAQKSSLFVECFWMFKDFAGEVFLFHFQISKSFCLLSSRWFVQFAIPFGSSRRICLWWLFELNYYYYYLKYIN